MGPSSVSFFSKSFKSFALETPVLKAGTCSSGVYPVKEIKGFHRESYRMLVIKPGALGEAAAEQSLL